MNGVGRLKKHVSFAIGSVFGRLVILGEVRRNSHWYYRCLCTCSKEVFARHENLASGRVKSCGCLRRDQSIKHGCTILNPNGTKEYRSWGNMKQRCENPHDKKYKYYGARGISVCDRWRNNFAAFLADVGECPKGNYSIDRYPNNDGNYEPGNVRWATAKQQNNNRRFKVR